MTGKRENMGQEKGYFETAVFSIVVSLRKTNITLLTQVNMYHIYTDLLCSGRLILQSSTNIKFKKSDSYLIAKSFADCTVIRAYLDI